MSSLYDKASLIQVPSLYKDGLLVSTVPEDRSGDFVFSRGSNLAATRVGPGPDFYIEKGRENLLLQSNQFDTTWTTSSSASITGGQADKDGGTSAWKLQAITASTAYVRQLIDASSNVSTFSFYAKAGTSNWTFVNCVNVTGFFDLANGAVGALGGGSNVVDASITSVGGGWYRVSLTGLGVIQQRIYTASANGNSVSAVGDNIYIQDAQVEVGLAATEYIETTTTTSVGGILADQPRIDYTGGGCGSLLLEPSSTNDLSLSEYFASNYWASNNVTITSNETKSPEGVNNASMLQVDAIGQPRLEKGGAVSTTYSVSIFIKKNVGDYFGFGWYQGDTGNNYTRFNISTGVWDARDGSAFSDEGVADYGDGWYRISAKLVTSSSSSKSGVKFVAMKSDGFIAGLLNDQFYIYGTQIELGSYPTSYIPTYGTSVTRAADVCGGAGNSSTFNSSEGVFYAEIAAFEGSDNTFAISLSDGSSNNRIFLSLRTPQSIYRAYSTGGGDMDFTGLDVTSLSKVAVRYSLNNFSLWVNGVKRGETLSYAGIPANTLNNLSFDRNGAGELDFYGKTKQVLTFNTALSDAECIELTTI